MERAMEFLVFQHVEAEHPGIFRDFWRAAGIKWTAIEFDKGHPVPPDLKRFDAMIVMGGPMDVWQKSQYPWLIAEIAAIRTFVVNLGRPFLGVCLGHQLLAEALGGSVALASGSEVGICPVRFTRDGEADPLLAGLSSPLTTFQWHSAEVKALPSDAVVLAETDLCRIQAFRWRDLAYGFQFHAEITRATVGEWGCIPAYRQSLEDTLGAGASERLESETMKVLPLYNQTASRLNDNFLALVRHAAAARALRVH
jgi:GMP synthase-like glutamine amidotransferase